MMISQKVNGRVVQTPFRSQVAERYDVIVVGLGTAGAISAITAAEKGLKVLAVERTNGMGGVGTAGGVLTYYFGRKGGRFEEIDRRVADLAQEHYTPSDGVNGEIKRYVLEQAAVAAGVEIRYEAGMTGVLMEGRSVCGIAYFGADGMQYAGSKVVIDCTGDAHVCATAGCELRRGRALDGKPQPYSNVRLVMRDGRVRVAYNDSGYADPQSAEEVSRAIVQSALHGTHLKERYDDAERMLRIASLLGIREGRFIVSEEDVALERFLNGQVTEQPVFYAYSNLDTHSKDIALESEAVRDWLVAAGLWSMNFHVPVPLGAHIPSGFEGLLAAGRCIGLDHDIASHTRMKRDMQKSGEAAANAAYLSIRRQVPLKDVDYDELIALLRETGCYEPASAICWLTDAAEIKAALASEKPGVAIWSARRAAERLTSELIAWTQEDGSEHLRKHAAIALALAGNRLALPVLREIVREKDAYVPKTSHLYSQARGLAAIYLIGKLGDAEMIPELTAIMEKPDMFDYQSGDRSLVYDKRDVRFQYFSHAWRALLAIGDSCPGGRQTIARALLDMTRRSDWQPQLTLHGESGIRLDMADTIGGITQNYLTDWKITR